MKIINQIYLSDLLSDLAKADFDFKNSENIKEALILYEEYAKLKDYYEENLYSQPNWEDNFSVKEMNSARDIYKSAKDKHLSKWDIPSAHMKALYSNPVSKKLENSEWLLLYAIEIKGENATFQISVDKDGAWNYQLNTTSLVCKGTGEFDILDYYTKKIKLTKIKSL